MCVHRYRVHDIGDPYVTYTIKVTLQQLDYEIKQNANGTNLPPKEIWRNIGKAFVGPQVEAQNINRVEQGKTSTPKVVTPMLFSLQ